MSLQDRENEEKRINSENLLSPENPAIKHALQMNSKNRSDSENKGKYEDSQEPSAGTDYIIDNIKSRLTLPRI